MRLRAAAVLILSIAGSPARRLVAEAGATSSPTAAPPAAGAPPRTARARRPRPARASAPARPPPRRHGATIVGSSTSSTGPTTTTATSTSATSTGGTTATVGATTGASSSGSSTYPAHFPKPPQVITFNGPVLANPEVYPVFFSQDATNTAFVSALTDFTQNITASAYFAAATAEYGVGPGTGGPVIQLAEAAPATIDDSAIQTWLAAKFAAGAPFPKAGPNTLIVLYYPAGTTITLEGSSSCSTFGGYHNGTVVGGGQEIAYAVVPRCDSTVDTATGAGSHEVIEASTDPYPMDNPAYAQVDDADIYWQLLLGGGEVGDMCAQFPNVFTTFPPFNYVVQRTWSNAAANAGRDPCQPELPGEVYAGAAPVLPDMSPLNTGGQPVNVRSITIPVGQTKSIPVDVFSEGPTSGPFTFTAVDPAPMLGSPQLLDLTVTPSTGVNGDVAMVTIDVLQAGPGNVELFYVTAVQGSSQAIWFGTVGN